MGIRHWNLRTQNPEAAAALEGAGLSPLTARLLAARGVAGPQEAKALLTEAPLFDPFLLKDMDKAVTRLQQAMESGERIVVYGDYDCDGVTATALLYSYLETVGADVLYYIPDREVEGYGLNKEAITFLHNIRKVSLIVTVDNGISAHEEVAFAQSLGLDVIITDHHQPRETLPDGVAVVDPHRADCPSPFKNLAGVGVAFKLVCALEGELGDTLLEHYGDLLALGTVGDVVELLGDNRTFVRRGLPQFVDCQRPGLEALIQVAGVKEKPITAETLAFMLVPRLNAAGRMGDVYHALELLLTEEEERGAELAEALDGYNRERKAVEETIAGEILTTLTADASPLNERALLLSGEDWHHGVVGILCSRLVERFGKPCFLISTHGEEGRASGRGVEGVSVIEGIAACGDWLTRYGGHAQAAGFSLKRENIAPFTRDFLDYFKKVAPVMPANPLVADCAITPGELTVEGLRALEKLEPFGTGNPSPVFALLGLRLEEIVPLSGDKHLRLRLSGAGGSVNALLFGVSSTRFAYSVGESLDLVVTAECSEYRGQAQVSVKVKDIRPAGYPQEALYTGKARYERFLREEGVEEIAGDLLPTREEVGLLYRYLRKNQGFPHGCDLLFGRLVAGGLSFEKMMVALDALWELQLIRCTGFGAERQVVLLPAGEKTDLSRSTVLQGLQRRCGIEC